jgi:transposase-like protein
VVFDKEKLKEFLKDQHVSDTEGLQALLRDMTKEVIETLYAEELTDHLGYERHV